MSAPAVPPHRIAAGYALGVVLVLLAVALWLRGFGRLLLPLAVVVGAVVVVRRVWRAIRAPVD